MSDIILLDSAPLGLITNPRASAEGDECNLWMRAQLNRGVEIIVPEIADYEVRRELLRAGRTRGIANLDSLKQIGYAPITTRVMLRAAEFWARARQTGRPTASDRALDGDMILAAQASVLADEGHQVTVATTNVSHLALFTSAQHWRDINP